MTPAKRIAELEAEIDRLRPLAEIGAAAVARDGNWILHEPVSDEAKRMCLLAGVGQAAVDVVVNGYGEHQRDDLIQDYLEQNDDPR